MHKLLERQLTDCFKSRAPSGPEWTAFLAAIEEVYARADSETGNPDHEELARREKVMRSLLEDLQLSKSRLEAQKADLQEVNRKLEALGAVKDEFVANVSHELRTPLTVIREGIALVCDAKLGPVTKNQREFLNEISANAERLADLVNNILDISKFEQGRLRLRMRPVRLQGLFDAVIKQYRLVAGRRSFCVEAPGLPSVMADPDRISQVLVNLISNAIKFTGHDGHITLMGRLEGDGVSVSVGDDGPGIAPEDLPKLFQRFSQLGQDPGGRKGTGLGLALCKDLIELHGGTISAHSEAGKGTTFKFILPAYSHERALEAIFLEMQAAQPDASQGIGMLVLDASVLLEADLPSPSANEQALDFLASFIRKHTHRGDHVLSIQPCWVMIFADIDAGGLLAMQKRLETALRGQAQWVGRSLEFRWVKLRYPQDGSKAGDLFQKATQSLKQKGASR
ncbi:MAG: HAMP domain-containing histidine kinase [Candidatus Omnitrophica bacterium]|nr:HAMP domain-containing histidine kinase [Candidatus Omnitrophota bacterium]